MFRPEVKSKIGEDIAILVKLDNHPWNYLCECGDASALTVKEYQNCNAVFISHTHMDHFANFDAVLRHQIGMQRKVTICGPEKIARQVQSRIRSYNWNLVEADAICYEVREVLSTGETLVFELAPPLWALQPQKSIAGNTIFEHKDFKVTAVLLDHKTPVLAYKFEEPDRIKIDLSSSGFQGGKWVKDLKLAFEQQDKTAQITIDGKDYVAATLFHLLHVQKGDSVGIIMDHAANEENHAKIRQHFEGCRIVFMESFYKAEDKALADLNYHSYSTMSAKVMRAANVQMPVPVHFSRKYSEQEVQELIAEFELALKEYTSLG